MSFAYPQLLWTLLLLPLLPAWELARRGPAALRDAPLLILLLLRLCMIALVCLALAGTRLELNSQESATILVLDQSLSTQDDSVQDAVDNAVQTALQNLPEDHAVGLVRVGDDAQVLSPIDTAFEWNPQDLSETADQQAATASNLAAGVQAARNLLSRDTAGNIVLLTDGLQTEGDLLGAVRGFAQLPVDTVPLQAPPAAEVWIEGGQAPQDLRTGEPFSLTIQVGSSQTAQGRLNLYRNNFVTESREITLQPGLNEFVFQNLTAPGGFSIFEAEVLPESDQDRWEENNRFEIPVSLRGSPRVLIIDPQPTMLTVFTETLRAQDFQVETRSPGGLPQDLGQLQAFDVLILSDTQAAAISPTQAEVIRRWVVDLGGAFILTGGENSFSAGGYLGSPLARMLPVRMEKMDREEMPAVALLVVLDRSGSMASTVQGQTKLSLAGQGAALALDILGEEDYFGLNVVDTVTNQVIRLEQIRDKSEIRMRLQQLTPGGGGIYVYTGLDDAFQDLNRVDAKIKHVILFSDASDAEQKVSAGLEGGSAAGESSLELAAAMLSNRITTSVVALGYESDRDVDFLKALAARGNGRFYLTSNALNLPQIFTAETIKVTASSILEGAFLAEPVGRPEFLGGIDWRESPLLLGYNLVQAEPAAETLLVSEKGDPLLVRWPFGLGSVTALATDIKPRWSAEWLQWPGYGQFWVQYLRKIARKADSQLIQVEIAEAPGQEEQLDVNISLARPGQGFAHNLQPQVLAVQTATGISSTISARQLAPGLYHAQVPRPQRGTMVLTISAPQILNQPITRIYSRPYPEEYRMRDTDRSLLRQVANTTGGRFDPSPDQFFTPPTEITSRRLLDLTPYCLALALILLPGEIALRRFLGRL